MRKKWLMVLVGGAVAGGCCQAQIRQDIWIHVTEQAVDGATFVHRVDLNNGVRSERWMINGSQVPEDAFEHELAEAQQRAWLAERVQQRAREREQEEVRRQESIFYFQAQRALARKQLVLVICDVESALERVRDERIARYHAFSPETIAEQEELDELRTQLLADARLLLNDDDDEEPTACEVFRETAEQLEPYIERLHGLYRATVKRAIDVCDDTRMLKELLTLVS